MFYSRTKGEVEQALGRIGFDSLTLLRPGLLGGRRKQHRTGERWAQRFLGVFGPVLPGRYRVVPPECVAAALLEAVVTARPGLHIVPSEQLLG